MVYISLRKVEFTILVTVLHNGTKSGGPSVPSVPGIINTLITLSCHCQSSKQLQIHQEGWCVVHMCTR